MSAREFGMRLLISLLYVSMLSGQTAWDTVLASLGQPQGHVGLRILEGHSPEAEALGISRGDGQLTVRQIRDISAPDLPIIWQQAELVSLAKLDPAWQVRATERWTGAPVLAVRLLDGKGIIWTATDIGAQGYERYPFLPQSLLAAGLRSKVEGRGLWAFFDASYRLRVDLPYLVAQWKQAGIGAIHVTSWQFDGASAESEAWLKRLIALCHEQLIQVYAWVELPHVSERFWIAHPECRERTATGMDASLDWRRLINLVNPVCVAQVETSVFDLLRRYNWDGVNLGELYFESLEGSANPARFTPFNDDVRAEYKALYGRDALDDLKGDGLPRLLAYRADLAARLQSDWLSKIASLRDQNPNLDIVLTHIDDRFDTNMRDALGADAARLLRGTEGLGTGFLIEDPATTWHLGPARYREIRKRYDGLTADPDRLSIDLNIVDRYQDVYPTKRQTGAELAALVHEASANFAQVALYFEYSLRPVDLPLLGMAAAVITKWNESNNEIDLTLTRQARLRWHGGALVNGIAWPLADGEWIVLPAGDWHIERAPMPDFTITDSNFRILRVQLHEGGYLIDYDSRAGGVALVKSKDGQKRLSVNRGKGTLRLSSTQPALSAERSSTQLLPRP